MEKGNDRRKWFWKRVKKGMTAVGLSLFLLISQVTGAAENVLQDSDTLYHDISFEEELEEAYEVLDLGDTSNVTSKLVLPYGYGIHVTISWESSDESVVDLQGNVVTSTEEDKDVILTAVLSSSKLDETKSKEFKVHVPKADAEAVLEQDTKEAAEYIDYILNNGYVLPDSKELGIRSDVSWELISGNAVIEGGKILKTDKSEERQPIQLKATLTYKGKEKSVELKNIVLLDEYAGYILTYFGGKEESKEMYMGYSYDGLHWMRLNNADAVLTSKIGQRQIRDPFIVRQKDGSFAVFGTNGWTSPRISIWDSEDLVTFENQRLCTVTQPGGVASGRYSWAPECNYDPITDTYYVYWSDPEANNGRGQTYYNTSKDLENFSEAGVLFEREYFIIDASIKKYKGDYYMVYDDATGDNDTGNGGRRIYLAKADSLEPGAFYPCSGVLSEGLAEGPFLFQNFTDGSWVTYYDYYSKHKFGYATTKDISTGNWEYQGICETMPWEEVRHGGVIPVTQSELDVILEAWAFEPPELSEIVDTEPVQVVVGTEQKALEAAMPTSVDVILSDGQIVEVPVQWDCDDLATDQEGKLNVIGKVGKCEYENVNQLVPELTVIVAKAPVNLVTIMVVVVVIVLVLAAGLILLKKRNK